MDKSMEELVDNEQPVVSFLVHEADMNHKDADNERLHKTIEMVVDKICKAFVTLIAVFLIAYTIRTALWQNTILSMKDAMVQMNDKIMQMAELHHGCVEVNHAEEADTP